MSPAITNLRTALIRECKEKNSLDPREYNLRGNYHVTITLTVDEIRAFLIATARTSKDASPALKKETK